MNYKTPGVYVEEIPTFPPSIAQVETAIPAFIGYTAAGPTNEPTRITSLMEYETLFGGAKPEAAFSVTVNLLVSPPTATASKGTISDYKMYYALQMYFANGGGPCYIVSVGADTETIDFAKLNAGLELLEKEDELTLIVFPEADALDTTDAYTLYNNALNHAEKMGDRFVIMDVIGEVGPFRTGLANTTALKYGAAYHPKLETALSYKFTEAAVPVTGAGAVTTLEGLKTTNSVLYNQAKKAIEAYRVVLGPSSAIAGVYAKTDSTVGVWKAPANVGLNSVVAPTEKISHEAQESLNVDTVAGKSINAIRSFTGKGTMVWGARTLYGNDNEWRYISVRRFFNMAEESIKKATERFVFESNDAKTWVRVQAMITNFLTDQWKSGALAGSTPEEAFYVAVGLNQTMSAQDIQEGRMNIEIGMAAVRPAEFIILRFSHKLQES